MGVYICPNYTLALAKNIEERVAQLERELTFLKSQGLTRDEQDSLLDPSRDDGSSPLQIWLWIAVILQFFMSVGLFFFMGSRDHIESPLSNDHGLERHLQGQAPEKGKPFLLPGMRRPN